MDIENLLTPERSALGEWVAVPGSTAEFRVSPYTDAWRDAHARKVSERTRVERREGRLKGGETLGDVMPSVADQVWRETCLAMLLHDVRGLTMGGEPATVDQVRELAMRETARQLWIMISEAIETVTMARAQERQAALGNSAKSSSTKTERAKAATL